MVYRYREIDGKYHIQCRKLLRFFTWKPFVKDVKGSPLIIDDKEHAQRWVKAANGRKG
jgi:hypothetical protein